MTALKVGAVWITAIVLFCFWWSGHQRKRRLHDVRMMRASALKGEKQ